MKNAIRHKNIVSCMLFTSTLNRWSQCAPFFSYHCARSVGVLCVYCFSVCKLWFTTCNQSWHQLNNFGEEKQSKIKKEKFNLIYKSDCNLIKVEKPSFSRLFLSQVCIVCFFWLDSNYSSHSRKKHIVFSQFTQFFAIEQIPTQIHATQRVSRFESNTILITNKKITHFNGCLNQVVRTLEIE